MMNDASEVKIRIREKYVVQITPAFKCNGVWPRSAAQWPSMTMAWPHPNMAAQVSNFFFRSALKLKRKIIFFKESAPWPILS